MPGSIHRIEFDTPEGNACEAESVTMFFTNSGTIERDIERFIRNNIRLLGAGARVKSRRHFDDILAAKRDYDTSADYGWCWPPFSLTVLH